MNQNEELVSPFMAQSVIAGVKQGVGIWKIKKVKHNGDVDLTLSLKVLARRQALVWTILVVMNTPILPLPLVMPFSIKHSLAIPSVLPMDKPPKSPPFLDLMVANLGLIMGMVVKMSPMITMMPTSQVRLLGKKKENHWCQS